MNTPKPKTPHWDACESGFLRFDAEEIDARADLEDARADQCGLTYAEARELDEESRW